MDSVLRCLSPNLSRPPPCASHPDAPSSPSRATHRDSLRHIDPRCDISLGLVTYLSLPAMALFIARRWVLCKRGAGSAKQSEQDDREGRQAGELLPALWRMRLQPLTLPSPRRGEGRRVAVMSGLGDGHGRETVPKRRSQRPRRTVRGPACAGGGFLRGRRSCRS
jgi:hypothetical protein